jgi:predicted PurR-regulated permease PerM
VQALKVLVIVMGVMIVVAFGVLVVTIINRSQDLAQSAGPYQKEISLPTGQIVDMSTAVGEATLRLQLLDGTEKLIVIDTERGRLRGILSISQP